MHTESIIDDIPAEENKSFDKLKEASLQRKNSIKGAMVMPIVNVTVNITHPISYSNKPSSACSMTILFYGIKLSGKLSRNRHDVTPELIKCRLVMGD